MIPKDITLTRGFLVLTTCLKVKTLPLEIYLTQGYLKKGEALDGIPRNCRALTICN